ncbi:MAG: SIS domain-containing protein, partial [Sulfuricurvum sp.]|nr:SIS domain-containing protein [Sulfuricurvum sp.]
MNFTSFIDEYLEHLNRVLRALDKNELEKLERLLGSLGEDQRVYIIGNGGSAATASHMVNDFGV